MIFIPDFFTFIVCSIFAIFSFSKIRTKKFHILDICIVVYWTMQVLPLLVQFIVGLESIQTGIWPYMYYAMIDTSTALIYDFITIITMTLMYLFSKKIKRNDKKQSISRFKKVLNNIFVKIFVLIGVFAPLLISVILSPNPSIYFTYSYFYTNTYDAMGSMFLFHANVVNRLCFVTVLFLVVLYFSRKNRSFVNNIDIAIAIFLCTWINGKRAILIFMLVGILAVDLLDSSVKHTKVITKALTFAAISLVHFYSFTLITGKQAGSDFFDIYNMYFSRLGCEKLSIYDHLYTNKMLDYSGQTIVYDLFFFIPREMWSEKPGYFATYFTAYAFRGDGRSFFLPSNLLVNIWTEFYANFGLVGHFLALLIVTGLSKIAEKTKNYLVYLSITLFLVAYMAFGFEFIVLIIYVVMVGSIILDKLNSLFRKRNKNFFYRVDYNVVE